MSWGGEHPEGATSTPPMSTLIQFRVSGDDEQNLLDAVHNAGMRPVDYVLQSAKLAANRPETALQRIQGRLSKRNWQRHKQRRQRPQGRRR